jgi:hypothetical protein
VDFEGRGESGPLKLEAVRGHPYRRKWKSERSNHQVKAVGRGRRTDIATDAALRDHPDDADVLAVTRAAAARWRRGGKKPPTAGQLFPNKKRQPTA